MRSLFLDTWIRIKSSYWFVPALMCVASAVLAFTAVTNSDLLDTQWIKRFSWLYANGPEGARSLLATVAGSMITVAGVVFSMTLLMVSHASAQIGPRVMEGFMRDRGSQVTLGTFISTFIYCLLVLRSVTSEPLTDADSPAPFVPHLAIIIAVGLALFSVAVLIFFVHHVPTRINVTSVVDRIGLTILRQLETVFPEPAGEGGRQPHQSAEKKVQQTVRLVGEGGYIRVIDNSGLMAIASGGDCVLEILAKPGDFCVRDTPLVNVRGRELDTGTLENVGRSFSWGGSRTQEQDVLFLIDQLAEISGRALSPGVNDQFTALACIYQMERVLREACERDSPQSHRYDENGELRLVASCVSIAEMADRFLLPMLQFSRGDAMTTGGLVEMVARALCFTDGHDDLKRTLTRHLEVLKSDAIPAIKSAEARARIAGSSALDIVA